MKNVLVVFNINAGRKQTVKYKQVIHKFLIQKCHKFKFISVDELNSVDIELYDTVIAMGGDGTVNKVVAYIANTDKVLGIIPTGTANLLASKLGLSMDLQKTLKIIAKGKTKYIDMMLINEKHSVLRCGFGYDSDIICKTSQKLKNKFGYFAYFIAGIIFALRLTPKTYDITCNNKTLSVNATCIIIGNASNMYRNIVSLGNNSELDDGYFDVFILKAKNPIMFCYEFLRIILGIRKNNPRAKYFKAKSLKINNHWTACHIDGEKTKLKGNITIDIIPDSIKVFSK